MVKANIISIIMHIIGLTIMLLRGLLVDRFGKLPVIRWGSLMISGAIPLHFLWFNKAAAKNRYSADARSGAGDDNYGCPGSDGRRAGASTTALRSFIDKL